jgi:hypothetical protein
MIKRKAISEAEYDTMRKPYLELLQEIDRMYLKMKAPVIEALVLIENNYTTFLVTEEEAKAFCDCAAPSGMPHMDTCRSKNV